MQMRSLVSEYLLSDLAGRGFLPGYGFPTNVVNFDNILYDVKGEPSSQSHQGSDSPNRRFQLRGTPSRQLDLAIRDYAPGSDVVVDGEGLQISRCESGLEATGNRGECEQNSVYGIGLAMQELRVPWHKPLHSKQLLGV